MNKAFQNWGNIYFFSSYPGTKLQAGVLIIRCKYIYIVEIFIALNNK